MSNATAGTRNKVIESTQNWINAEIEAVGYMTAACDTEVTQTMEQFEEWKEARVGGDSHAMWNLLHNKLAVGAGGKTDNIILRAFDAWKALDNLTMGEGSTATYFANQKRLMDDLSELGEILSDKENQKRLVRATFGGLNDVLMARYREEDKQNNLSKIVTHIDAKNLVVKWESYERAVVSLPSSSNAVIAKRTEVENDKKKKYTKAEKRAYHAQKLANAEKLVASSKKTNADNKKATAGDGKKDHSEMTCHFCNKKGHIMTNCNDFKASRDAFQKSRA